MDRETSKNCAKGKRRSPGRNAVYEISVNGFSQ